jgi:hypothetical protein
MRRTLTRAAGWLVAIAAIELVARALSYALSPDPRAEVFGDVTGGTRPVVIAAVALALGALVAGAVLWVAALAVRERHRLRGAHGPAPRLRLWRMVLRGAVLFAANTTVFTVVETSIHWREGLGFHGLHCLLGPVHRDALPLIGALVLVAVALAEAVGHAVAFGRRVVAAEGTRRRLPRTLRPVLVRAARPLVQTIDAPAVRGDRGPPLPLFG